MGFLLVLGVLLLIGAIPLSLDAKYGENGPLIQFGLGPVSYTLYPRSKREEKKPKKAEKNQPPQETPRASQTKPPQPSQQAPQKTEKGGSVTDFLPLIKVLLGFLKGLRRKLRVKHLELKLVLAHGDPCDLAVNYGRTWALIGSLMPQLEQVFVIQKQDVDVQCDFTAEKTTIYARAKLSIPLYRLLGLTGKYGFQALREYFTLRNKGKGRA